MEPDYISNVHKALSDNLEGFNKDEATFREELKNPEYAAKVHSALADNLEGFNKTPDEFYSAVGIGAEKKSPNQTEPSNTGSSESGLSSPEQNTQVPFKEAGNSNDGVGTFQDVAKESTKQVISPKLELPKDIELAKKHQEFLTQAEPLIKQQEVELERQKKIIDATTDPNVQRGLIDQYNNTVKEHQQSVASYNDIAQQAKDANQRISNNSLKIRKFQTNPEFAQSAWNDFTNSTVTAASKLISGIGTTIEGVGDLSAGAGHNLENMNQEGKLVGEEYKDLDNKVTDKIGDYTRNVVDDISKNLPVSDKAKQGLFNGEMTTNKAGALLGQAIGSMAAVVGGTALGGGVGGFATGYSLAMDEVYNSAKDAGLDDNDAASISLITSLPIAALDLIGAKGALPKAQMAKEIGERVLKDIAGKKITKETVTESAGRITKEYMKEMATEGATEAGQTLIQKGAEAGYDAVSGEKKYNTNFKDAMMETMESAIIGAVSGGAVKGGVDVGHKVFTKSVDVVKKYKSKNFAAKEAVKPTGADLKTELDAHVKAGVMSEQDAQEVVQNVENAKVANEGIPVKKNDAESNRIKKVRLALRRTELEEELKKAQFQSDKDAIKAKIEQIEEDYKTLNNAKPEARKEGDTTNNTTDEKAKGNQEAEVLTENKGEEISPTSEINNETITNDNKTETEAGVQHPESETKPNDTGVGSTEKVKTFKPTGDAGKNRKGIIETINESEQTTGGAKEKLKEVDPFYDVLSNKESMENAKKQIGLDIGEVKKKVMANTAPSAEKSAMTILLIKHYEKTKDYDSAIEVINAYDKQLREAGRYVQAASLWNKVSPETIVRNAKKVAEELGVELPTDIQSEILRRMGEVDKMPEGEEKSKATLEVLNYIADQLPITKGELFDAYRYMNMLSSPKGHEKNIYGNFFNMFLTVPATIGTSATYDFFKNPFNPAARDYKFTQIPKYYKSVFTNMPNAFIAAKETFANGYVADKILDINKTVDRIEALRKTKLPKGLTAVMRFLEAQDRFFSVMIANGEKVRLMQNGASEKEATEKATKLANEYLYRETLDVGDDQRLIITRALDGLGQAINKLRNYNVTTNKGKKINVGKPFGWFVPFVTTPINVAKLSLKFSPLAAAEIGIGTVLGKEYTKQQVAAATLGTMVLGIGATLALQGLTEWALPEDKKERELFYASGKKPFSVKIGNKWVPMAYFGPFALALGIPAALKHYYSTTKQSVTDNDVQKIAKALGSTAGMIMTNTPVQSVEAFTKIISGEDDVSTLKQLGYSAGQLIPANGLVRYVNSILDPVYRKSPGFLEAIESGLPGLSTDLDPYLDMEGEPSKRDPLNYALPYDLGFSKKEYDIMLEERRRDIKEKQLEKMQAEKDKKYEAEKSE